ncbi:MAG: AAA family ATPase [Peptostreptococcaceae bacterium]|nr:AAA family ATPase [Peptostreptococcaceae bacterium]
MQVSHSRVECFESCPFKYQLRYIDKIGTIKADNADNALYLGTALHTGLEKDVQTAIHEYYMQYPVITDEHINEAIKLEILIPKAAAIAPKGFNEVEISDDDFKGFIDLLAPAKSDTRLGGDYQELPNVYDIYDFKYSNNTSHYKDSVQIHLYKYFYEKLNPGKKIRKLFYLCVPKVNIKQKKTESLQEFRKRIQEEAMNVEPKLVEIEYDQSKVIDWLFKVKRMTEAEEFYKNQGWLCRYCDYSDYCQKGWDYMLLPKNERRNIEKVEKKVVWLYGSPFSGKTTFANKFPDPLMLNTDGNIKFVDAPFIPIKDQVEVVGRMTKRTMAWQVFKDVIAELEKKDNSFKTIIVDLLEDTYEYCRLYMYDQMGITHESDDSFRAWDKVRTEFLSTLKRLMALDYENIILISHEDTSKDITKKGGDKITAIKPNMQEKTANKVAGMVDIVARVIADGDIRTLSFKTNEVIFGGGRLTTSTNEIALDYDKFLGVYEEANKAAVASMTKPKPTSRKKKEEKVEDVPSEPIDNEEALANETKQIESEEKADEVEDTTEAEETDEKSETEEPSEEKPKTRVRKRREN